MIDRLRNMIATRGVVGTLKAAKHEAEKRLRRWSRRGRENAARDVAFDHSVGIDTHAKVEFTELDVADHADLVAYQPSPPDTVLELIDRAAIDHARFTFIDLGAGKGRPCFVAARRPFRKIVGVELSEQLCAAARTNLAALRDRERRCADVSFTCGDATTYELPAGPTVVYMYNPFGGDPMARLVAHLERSLTATPRELWVLYYNCACRQLFDNSAAFTRVDAGEGGDPWAIYRSACST